MSHETTLCFVPVLILGLTMTTIFSEELPEGSRTLQNATTEARVSIFPQPRVLDFGSKNGPALLWEDPHQTQSGVRLIAYEKRDGQQLIHAFDEPGEWIGENAFRTRSEDLELEGSFVLSGEELQVACLLTNRSTVERTLALWSIASLPTQGWIVTTASRGLENNQWVHGRVVSYWGTSLGEPFLRFGKEAIAIDLGAWPGSGSFKIGTRSNAGWVALVRPDLGQMVVARVPYDPADQYPDEDSNITIWVGDSPKKLPYAEMEWISPWTTLPPGKSFQWNFVLERRSFDPGAPITPDKLVDLIRQPTKITTGNGGVEAHRWRLDGMGPLLRDHFGKVTAWYSSDGKVIAKTPLWNNAPNWIPETSSLAWNESTIVEPDASLLPKWSPEGRTWRLGFSVPKEARSENRMLFQDGDAASGLVVALIDGDVSAYFWNENNPPLRLEAELTESLDHHVQVTYSPAEKTLSLQLNKSPSVSQEAPTVPMAPTQRLEIGRNARLPAEGQIPALKPFLGSLHYLEVLNVKDDSGR